MCGTTKKLEVHHIIPRHVSPERTLDWNNLVTLCKGDHLVHGHNNNFRRFWVPNIRSLAANFVNARDVAESR
jgi:5-methylcytosine-specific restriction endonuclease McrA